MKLICILSICVLAIACTPNTENKNNYRSRIQSYSDSLFLAEQNDDLDAFLTIFSDSIISMPDYQPPLDGIGQARAYYAEIFKRQNISKYEHQTEELIDLGSMQVEFGTFRKEYTTPGTDTLLTLDGKYCRVWSIDNENNIHPESEGTGYFHQVENEQSLFVKLPEHIKGVRRILAPEQTPLLLRANNALMAKYVSESQGALHSTFFTEDGRFMPFAHATLNTLKEIRPYLISYGTHGAGFKIDTIAVYTFHFKNGGDYILEYPRFYVRWSMPTLRGGAQGKGLRLWQRQADGSYKLFREIGFHDRVE